ncbi:hypothetical protein AVEN_176921-1 [Araneus ventricosus]|uniref:DDE-1 domain-containing protein n=1 Tax=Araneus ventricosus TaxID=182803 RepID=A0A4Y2X0I2_ARAVE|nr:hypothetical protein AVEN_176921-1 [Araneus ventricosus]
MLAYMVPKNLNHFMIGESKNPSCFAEALCFPMDYEANTKAWMTGELFENWQNALDQKMARQKRRTVLFINNCEEHPSAIISRLKSVKVEFMPPNTTSKFQSRCNP